MLDNIRRWLALHPNWALTFVTVAALLPFLGKPFNIDDPLFIWAAHQIQAHPCDPYGFDVNWDWTAVALWKITDNPPLDCYYLALAAGVFGWSELALHFAFLLPAIAVILGTYRLARHFCNYPILVALATLCAPVFLVSAATVMCDVSMLAFWVWAMVFWIEGLEQNNYWRLCGAGLLIALAEMTKYYGFCLVPLLCAYSLIQRRRFGKWVACLLIPLAVLCLYQWVTKKFYGYALMSEAANFAKYAKSLRDFSKTTTCTTALTFTGGCLAVATFFLPLLWRWRMLTIVSAGMALIGGALLATEDMMNQYGAIPSTSRISVEIQIVFWAIGGAWVLALAVADVWKRRDARSWLLVLWVMGTFLFAAFFNWTVNARSILPMAPAAGILIARRLEKKSLADGETAWPRGTAICLTAGAAMGLLVARSDFLLAVAVRQSAQQVCAKCGQGPGALIFQGHWGFQYYMDTLGATALDVKRSRLQPGDYLAVPVNNTSLFPVNTEMVTLRQTIAVPGPHWLTTWNETTGAGFYAAAQGPLPFAFGRVPPENVFVYELKPPAPTK